MLLPLLLACTLPADMEPVDTDVADPVGFLAEAGPYRAGYRKVETSYGDRTLPLALWYPTDATTGAEVKYRGAFAAPGVLDDPAPAAGGPWPVVVFSHGHQAYAETLGHVSAHLATHGFVVAAPDHTGNTTFDGADRATEIYWQRPADVSAALDAVLDGAQADLPTVDVAVGLGHSFGGYTILLVGGARWDAAALDARCATPTDDGVCSTYDPADAAAFAADPTDPRVVAVAALAPGDHSLLGATGLASLAVPLQLHDGDLDPGTPGGAALYWADLPAGDRVSIAGAGHNAWTDFAGVAGLDTSTMAPADAHRIADVYLGAFVRRHALGESAWDGVLDGSVVVDAAVTVTAKP